MPVLMYTHVLRVILAATTWVPGFILPLRPGVLLLCTYLVLPETSQRLLLVNIDGCIFTSDTVSMKYLHWLTSKLKWTEVKGNKAHLRLGFKGHNLSSSSFFNSSYGEKYDSQ